MSEDMTRYLTRLFSSPLLPGMGLSGQRAMGQRLAADGWDVRAEMFVHGLGREAWLDLYATRNGVRLAIEIDRGRPKASSLDKLSIWNADHKYACYFLDRELVKACPPGVVCLHLNSRACTQEELAFKGFGREFRIPYAELRDTCPQGPRT